MLAQLHNDIFAGRRDIHTIEVLRVIPDITTCCQTCAVDALQDGCFYHATFATDLDVLDMLNTHCGYPSNLCVILRVKFVYPEKVARKR